MQGDPAKGLVPRRVQALRELRVGLVALVVDAEHRESLGHVEVAAVLVVNTSCATDSARRTVSLLGQILTLSASEMSARVV